MPAAVVGLVNEIGVGVFRVHPLIMTISMGLVVSGAVNVYSRANIVGGTRVPPEITWLGGQTLFGFLPNSLLLFVPLAALILVRPPTSRLRAAAVRRRRQRDRGATRRRSRGSVLVVLYLISAILAGVAGLLYAGVIGAPRAGSWTHTCCRPSPRSSSAARRSSAAAAGTPGRSSGR